MIHEKDTKNIQRGENLVLIEFRVTKVRSIYETHYVLVAHFGGLPDFKLFIAKHKQHGIPTSQASGLAGFFQYWAVSCALSFQIRSQFLSVAQIKRITPDLRVASIKASAGSLTLLIREINSKWKANKTLWKKIWKKNFIIIDNNQTGGCREKLLRHIENW